MIRALLSTCALAALTTGALAADLPRRAAPPPVFAPVPIFTWTGFYAGLHSAYAFTENPNIRTTGLTPVTQRNVDLGFRPASLKSEVDGFSKIGGGFGYNYQFTPGSGIVVGAAFDMTWTDLQKSTGFVGAPNNLGIAGFPATSNGSAYQQNLDYLGTVNGKLGYAFDRFLVYGTGGLAFGQVEYGAIFNDTLAQIAIGGGTAFLGGSGTLFETGYNYGGGIEYAIPTDSFLSSFSVGRLLGIKSDVTIKAEYIRYDLGSRNLTIWRGGGVPAYNARFGTEGSLIRAGFNYKFSAY